MATTSLSLGEHWEVFIKPHILLFENKMEIEDIRHTLFDYFVEKGIKFRSEINWGEIVKDERFEWISPYFFYYKLSQMVGDFKKANPNIEVHDITIEDLRQYLDERARNPDTDYHISKPLEDYILYNINVTNSI